MIKIKTNRNEPKVNFTKCEFTIYTNGKGQRVVKCNVTSRLETPAGILVSDMDKRINLKNDPDNTIEVFCDFPCPETSIVTTGYAVCDPRDKFDQDLGRRVARIRAEKAAYRLHSRVLQSSVSRYIDFLVTASNRFFDVAEKVENDEIDWGEKKNESTSSNN